MQFREVTYNQQLQLQRLVHGPEADITERSLPNMPGSSMREILKHSQHPQNLEQVLLTLRRPANSTTRRSFAEVGGELILIQKVTSSEPVVSDFKIANFGQIMDLPEGMLYPTQSKTTLFETWLRVEMLDALRMMIEENLVRSLLPEMQLKLISDMLQLSEDPQQPELVRLYSFAVAVAGVKRFHAARAAAIAGGFPAKTAAFLAGVLDGPHAEESIYSRDPCEQLKALATAAEGLYLVALTNKQGDYTLAVSNSSSSSCGKDKSSTGGSDDPAAAVAAAVAAGATLEALDRSLEGLPALQDTCAGPLLSKALAKLWEILQDREQFVYTVPASIAKQKADAAAAAAAGTAANGDSSKEAGQEGGKKSVQEGEETEAEETEEQKQLRAAAEEAVAVAKVTFDENWHMFLKAVYDTQLVPVYAGVGMQLLAGLLQLLVHKEGTDKVPLPDQKVLQQIAAYTKHPVLPVSGSILAAMAAAAPATAGSSGSSAAIVSLPGHANIEHSALAKSCCCCNKHEGQDKVRMLRCGQCGCNYYCSAGCQKADWRMGHKGVCKELGAWRTKAQTVAAASNGSGSS